MGMEFNILIKMIIIKEKNKEKLNERKVDKLKEYQNHGIELIKLINNIIIKIKMNNNLINNNKKNLELIRNDISSLNQKFDKININIYNYIY